MAVVATAGHVDHGKSTLVRALTGIEPDRWEEERRRGMTLDLGFAWTTLPSGRDLAFVDVPGHERFVPTMLAGAGPVPAVVLVVAADEGWMPQSAEHLAALDALGVRHGVLVVTRSDLADPARAVAEATAALEHTSLRGIPAVAVSAISGSGLTELRQALDDLVDELPEPLQDAPVRFWVDRAFTIRGAGTVVTGTLGAGTVRVGDEFDVAPSGRRVVVRGVQASGRDLEVAHPVSRVALNLRGVAPDDVARGQSLVTPGAWTPSGELDVRLDRAVPRLPAEATWHVGSAAVPARLRPLGDDLVRVTLDRSLPWHVGDLALLRDPGAHEILAGVTVLDPSPPSLRVRGAARRRAAELAATVGADRVDELRRRGLVRTGVLRALGVVTGPADEIAPGWQASEEFVADVRMRIAAIVSAADPVAGGVPTEEVRERTGLPDAALLRALVVPPFETVDGRVRRVGTSVPPAVAAAVTRVLDPARPFAAPEAAALVAAGLGPRELAAAVRAGLLDKVADGVYLGAGVASTATDVVARLPQPFSAAEAKAAWGTTRRVAMPLLETLAARGVTVRTDDGRHRLRSP